MSEQGSSDRGCRGGHGTDDSGGGGGAPLSYHNLFTMSLDSVGKRTAYYNDGLRLIVCVLYRCIILYTPRPYPIPYSTRSSKIHHAYAR